jgi:cell division protein FtsB
MGEYDDISKNKEEQEERLEAIKQKNRDLEDYIKLCNNDIEK